MLRRKLKLRVLVRICNETKEEALMSKIERNFIRFLAFAFLSVSVVTVVPPVEAQESSADAAQSQQSQNSKLYLDFKAAALINVLMVLSELSGINFVAGKEVANREVNMVLDDVTIEDALDAVSRGSNISFDYFPDRNLYLFRASADKEDQPQLVTRVLNYITFVQVNFVRFKGMSQRREAQVLAAAGAAAELSVHCQKRKRAATFLPRS